MTAWWQSFPPCLFNLAEDKPAVLREAYRVLKPGGRFGVSDIVWLREVPRNIRENLELWAGCIAGAMTEETYARLLMEAGFCDVEMTITHIYGQEDIPDAILDNETKEELIPYAGSLVSAFVGARKPEA